MAILSTTTARGWLDCALNLAFPPPESLQTPPKQVVRPFCEKCGYPYEHLPASPFVCATCMDRNWSFGWARAGYMTEGQVLEAVGGFKYHEEYYRLRQLTDWLAATYDDHAAGKGCDALVPVPLFHRRYRERGFNQAYELARVLGRARGLRVLNCLRRLRETPAQVGLNRTSRWENMRGAFAFKGGFDVAGLRLLLIDDVFTTGATTNACARVLVAAGAGQVNVLTVSRS